MAPQRSTRKKKGTSTQHDSSTKGRKEAPKSKGRGRGRPPRSPLFMFYKISRLHPLVDHSANVLPQEIVGTGCCRPDRRSLSCPCPSSRSSICPRFSLFEYKFEITMAVQVLCLLVGTVFYILHATRQQKIYHDPDSSPTTAPISTSTESSNIPF